MSDGRTFTEQSHDVLEPYLAPVVGADVFEKAHSPFDAPTWNNPGIAKAVLFLALCTTAGVSAYLADTTVMLASIFLVGYATLFVLAALD